MFSILRLYIISLGLDGDRHLTLEGLDTLQKVDRIFLKDDYLEGKIFFKKRSLNFETLNNLLPKVSTQQKADSFITYLLNSKGDIAYVTQDQTQDEIVKKLLISSLQGRITIVPGVITLGSIASENQGDYKFNDLLKIIEQLHGDQGCPWDKEQTHTSLRPFLIEESYEVIEAIDSGDVNALCEELGDVLLQVLIHSEIAKKENKFSIDDVINSLSKKMIRRHPHVFGDKAIGDSEAVLKKWDEIKRKERTIKAISQEMEYIPKALPALMRAEKVQSKAKSVGFDWNNPEDAMKKIFEESKEIEKELLNKTNLREELGDLLFSVVNVIRLSGLTSELILQEATEKFINRFQKMEKLAKNDGKALKSLTFTEMNVYWEQGKHEG